MKIFEVISELHHMEPISNPLKATDTITVYHGYNDITNAILTAKYGLSGKERVPRVYSYESDNNPLGLFVTASLKTAKKFTGGYIASVVMQFDTKVSELEAPVWPGGTYTGYGQYSQYFGHGREAKIARIKKRKELEKQFNQDPELDDIVKTSDNPYMASWLTSAGESQALFIGHLNPNRITQFYVRDIENQLYTSDWYTISKDEFLQKFEHHLKDANKENVRKKEYKLFSVTDEFDPHVFLDRIKTKYKIIDIDETLSRITNMIIKSDDKIAAFKELMGIYLWPKQMPQAFKWLIKTYRKNNETNRNT